jgi:hypothetical protein
MKHIILSLLGLIGVVLIPLQNAQAAYGDDDISLTEARAHYRSSWRNTRRMGAGINFGGVYGLAAIQVELNLNEQWGTQIGYGGTGHFSAFAFQIKRVLGGHDFSPYASTGVVRWASRSDEAVGQKDLNPAYLSRKFLSDKQKSAPGFEELLIPLSVGLQYAQTNGPWAGASVFVEVNALTDIEDLKAAATGTLGMAYFF